MINLILVIVCLGAWVVFSAQPTQFTGFHRSGQTFLTWTEDNGQTNEKYRIYRSSSAITSGNLGSAAFVAEVKEGSSYFREMHNCDGQLTEPADPAYIERFIIQPVSSGKGTELSATTGLFVHTVSETSPGEWYYAITTVTSGNAEETTIGSENSIGPITEQKGYPEAVKYLVDNVNSLDYYILWLDHRVYNSYSGNAFPFMLYRDAFADVNEVPDLYLDGIGTHFPSNYYSHYGNMDYYGNGTPTWYFGHHMSLLYNGGCEDGDDGYTLRDTIANYVQYKHMQAALWARRHYNLQAPKFRVGGHSMGGSGALGFGIAFPGFVTSVWAHEGMTQYASPGVNGNNDTLFANSIFVNYGHPSLANPVKFLPFNDQAYPQLDWVTQFNGNSIYDMRDAIKVLSDHTAVSFGLLCVMHGTTDSAILFPYHGEPFEEYIRNSRHPFCYSAVITGHNAGNVCTGMNFMPDKMRWDESRPGFSNVPPIQGCCYNDPNYEQVGSRTYMAYVMWGTMDEAVMGNRRIVETDTSWSIPIISVNNCASRTQEFNVDITPRNLQRLQVVEGDTFTYRIQNASNVVEASGEIVADSLNLLLIPNVPIRLSGAIASVVLKERGTMFAQKVAPVGVKGPSIAVTPNPFNPRAMITLNAVQPGGIFSIFSPDGKCVTHIMNAPQTVMFDGSRLHSGVYIVRYMVNGKVLGTKMTLLK